MASVSKATTYTSSGATFSKNHRHRYALWRFWDEDLPKLVLFGLHPSTTDESNDDPTIRRCIGFAKREGLGGLLLLNVYSWLTPKPAELFGLLNYERESRVAHAQNRRIIQRVAARHHDGLFVAAWGAHLQVRDEWARLDVAKFFPSLWCFGMTQSGSPKHPLYLAANTELLPFPR